MCRNWFTQQLRSSIVRAGGVRSTQHGPPPPTTTREWERSWAHSPALWRRRGTKTAEEVIDIAAFVWRHRKQTEEEKVRNWPRERLCHCRRWSQWEAAQNSWIHHTNVYELSSIRTPQNFYGLKIPDGGILLRRLTSKKFKFLPNMRSHGKVILHFGGGMLGHPPDRPE